MTHQPTYDEAMKAHGRSLLLAAIRAANGEIVAARGLLGLPHRRMYRLIRELELVGAIEQIRRDAARAAHAA